jgi:hypothetical protein
MDVVGKVRLAMTRAGEIATGNRITVSTGNHANKRLYLAERAIADIFDYKEKEKKSSQKQNRSLPKCRASATVTAASMRRTT